MRNPCTLPLDPPLVSVQNLSNPGKLSKRQHLRFENILSDSIHEVISSSLLFCSNYYHGLH